MQIEEIVDYICRQLNVLVDNQLTNIIVGMVTGIFFFFFVTKIYRWKDKKIESSKFIAQLCYVLEKAKYFSLIETVPISDAHINYIYSFFEEIPLPLKYSWIKFNKEELAEVNAAIELLNKIRIETMQCHMMIGWLSRDNYPAKGKADLQMKIDNLKDSIILNCMSITSHWVVLNSLLKRYTDSKCISK